MPCIVQALMGDYIIFLAPYHENIRETKGVWEVVSNSSRLRLNMHNIVPISSIEQCILGMRS